MLCARILSKTLSNTDVKLFSQLKTKQEPEYEDEDGDYESEDGSEGTVIFSRYYVFILLRSHHLPSFPLKSSVFFPQISLFGGESVFLVSSSVNKHQKKSDILSSLPRRQQH